MILSDKALRCVEKPSNPVVCLANGALFSTLAAEEENSDIEDVEDWPEEVGPLGGMIPEGTITWAP